MKGKLLRQGVLETDRGCPYTCAYCNTYGQELNYKINNNSKYFRLRDLGRVHDQLKILVNKYKVEFIYMAAEVLFAMPKEHRKEFVKMYSRFKIPFFCQNRAEVINEETVHDLETMNCHTCSLGLEHGNDEFRKVMLNRRVTNDTYIRALKCFKNSKITVSVNNIIGFPDETEEMIKSTIKLNRELGMTSSGVNVFYPYKGTPLGDHCFNNDLVDLDKFNNFSNERRESSLIFSEEHHEMINRYYRNWDFLIHPIYTYFGLRVRYLKYRDIILKKLGIYEIARDVYRSQKRWFRPGRAS